MTTGQHQARGVKRIKEKQGTMDASQGTVVWSPAKSIWIGSVMGIALIGAPLTFSTGALLVFLISSGITLCAGHSVGMHRRLVHRSFDCPLWLERILVYLGVLVGIDGPHGMIRVHDLRDWAQRQTNCHDYFAHRQPMLIDAYWQIHCDIRLNHPPELKLEPEIQQDAFYLWLQQTWMAQQIPWILIFGFMGGISWVIWGVFLRVAVSVSGHWLVGYFAHHQGGSDWFIKEAAVQGYNVPFCATLTFGECWHNNHHAFPGSARLGLYPGQLDLGWYLICILKRIGWISNIRLPSDLEDRNELKQVDKMPITSKATKISPVEGSSEAP